MFIRVRPALVLLLVPYLLMLLLLLKGADSETSIQLFVCYLHHVNWKIRIHIQLILEQWPQSLPAGRLEWEIPDHSGTTTGNTANASTADTTSTNEPLAVRMYYNKLAQLFSGRSRKGAKRKQQQTFKVKQFQLNRINICPKFIAICGPRFNLNVRLSFVQVRPLGTRFRTIPTKWG